VDRETYTVGRLAAELGVTTRTLRFYEEAGIVTPARTGSGAARSYDARDRARLVLALRGKRFGMSLAEIREIVDMYDAEPGESGQIQRLLASLETVRADLLARRTELTRTLREVDDVTRRCESRLAELAAPGTSRTSRGRTSAPPPARGVRSGRLGAAANASSQVTGAHHR
jgi:DNA-binding transcriptional MerR regulator